MANGKNQCKITYPSEQEHLANDNSSVKKHLTTHHRNNNHNSEVYSLDVATQVNDDLKRVAYWCSQNSLLINPIKTKVLVVGTRQMLQRVSSDFKLDLLGKELAPVLSVKDLGLFVDSTLIVGCCPSVAF